MTVEHFRIGEFQLALHSAARTYSPAPSALTAFTTRGTDRKAVDLVDIEVTASERVPAACSDATLMDPGPGFWRAYRDGARTRFRCYGNGAHCGVWRDIGSEDARRFDVITHPTPSFVDPGATLPHPLAFPSAELMVLSHIATRSAAILHACGVRDHGSFGAGYLFCGRSGAGKSTTARLWQGSGAVLNDDRVLLRRHADGGLRIHGTPWHGDVATTDPGSAPLRAVFFLEHAPEHWLVRLPAELAQRKLLTSAWLPLWDTHRGVPHTLALCAQLVREVPCYQLGFRRDSQVIDLVREAGSHGRRQSMAVPA